MKALLRWLISITDMPLLLPVEQLVARLLQTSSGNTAGPGEKLKARICREVLRCRPPARHRRRPSLRRPVPPAPGTSSRIRRQAVDALQPGELIALFQPDQAHALGIAPDHRNVLHRRAHQHAVLAHEHDLIVHAHLQRADHEAVAVGDLQRDDALAAAAMLGKILQRRQLAEAVLRCGEDEALLRYDQRIDALLIG